MSATPESPISGTTGGAEGTEGWRVCRRSQAWEVAVLGLIYLLQVSNAEMLRRACGADLHAMTGEGTRTLVTEMAFVLATRVHPVAMVVVGVWMGVLALTLLLGRRLPRWALDAPGLWFVLRLVLEFVTINGLIFAGSNLVSSAVLLGQIVIYLPFFVITWGWIFHRVDRVGRSAPGRVVLLGDADPNRAITEFDYYHSSLTTLLNRTKPTISGMSRRGRVLVLLHQVMLMALYAVAFARILQLTRAVI